MGDGFGIREYPDVAEIYSRIAKLVNQPIRPVKREEMEQYIEGFQRKYASSKPLIDRARAYIPGGVQHNLAFNYPYPVVFDRAEGAFLYDRDGNRHIDFLQAGGPTVLGSNDAAVREKVIELIRTTGPSTGLFHEYELKIAEFICDHMPGVDMFRMLGSGTEGCMAAIRVARLATGKKNIIKMGGAYHGWSDSLVYALRVPGTAGYDAHGIPRASRKYTQEAFPNDIRSLEPMGTESGTRPVDRDHNRQIRELCDRFGALLIFDEVVTGFRIGISGAQGYFGVKPDLTVFGKVVAGGYPAAGGLGGSRDLMEYLAAGLQTGKKKVLIGGTLAANPLSAAAGYFTLVEIEQRKACEKAGAAGDRLTKGLEDLIAKYGLPFVAYNQGSICHLETTGTMFLPINMKKFWTIPRTLKEISIRKHMMEEMGAAYMMEGIVTLAGSRMYTSMADTDEVIDEALDGFERVFRKIQVA
jgi:glutamate-1-semialdehyde 2,1-aminomutase